MSTKSLPTRIEPRGQTVLITGGAGSFGQALVRDLLDRGFEEIRIFSRDECKQDEMRVRMAEPRLKFYIGDVRNRSSVDVAMDGVHFVFHAAALKQVPSCEFFPLEAVETNVNGSHNVIESAVRAKARCVVCLGTDKAVYPINAMGMTKALMEKVAQSSARRLGESDTLICSVRYGNVMYTRGSVIPLFVRQIKESLPLTVTDPNMTRFMLPLRDSVQLVEFAFENARQGDIFIRKAPACTIGNLAKALLDIFQSKSKIKTIGVRHGEKMHETLASLAEAQRAEDLGDFLRIPMDDRDMNYAKYFTEGKTVEPKLHDYDSLTTTQLSLAEIKDLLLSLPEIQSELSQRVN